MRIESLAARCLTIVDRTLRASFPGDYEKRCLYAAFGLRALLKTRGAEATVIGGDVLAFVVSADTQRAGLQGFGFGSDGPAHYWVEADGLLIDIGPHYLPRGSSYSAAKVPMVAWRKNTPLPPYLRYRESVRYAQDVELVADSAIMERMKRFIEDCCKRNAAQSGQPKPPAWLLTDDGALRAAAKAKDVWALNALRFVQVAHLQDYPF